MNNLRDEITDAVIELVFCSFPAISDEEFRGFVHKVLCIVDYAALEVVKVERTRRFFKVHQRSKN